MSCIDSTAEYVKTKLAAEGSGHDWWHTYRVWKVAQRISQAEGADLLVVQGRPDNRERQVSIYRANDGHSVRSFSGVKGLDQVISLQAQPSER